MRGRLSTSHFLGIFNSGNDELVFPFSGEQATILTFIVRPRAMA